MPVVSVEEITQLALDVMVSSMESNTISVEFVEEILLATDVMES
jgi:hypothetical protein